MPSLSTRLRRLKRRLSRIRGAEPPSLAAYLGGGNGAPPSAPERGPAAGNEWDRYRAEIENEWRRNPMDFLRQPVISRTVHPNQQELAEAYLAVLTGDAFAREHILSRLHDVPVGDPYLCEHFPLASPISVQHAYYIFLMKKHLDVFIPEAPLRHLLELGGGYGNFCRLACAFGYSGRYVIADFPEMHQMQRHYLHHAMPRRMAGLPVEFRSITDSRILPEESPSLFMATFSLSEMPLSSRTDIERCIGRFDYLFMAYNRAFGGVDNREYFASLRDRLNGKFAIDIVPDEFRAAWFLFGRRRSFSAGSDGA